jgi:hypothetical protein
MSIYEVLVTLVDRKRVVGSPQHLAGPPSYKITSEMSDNEKIPLQPTDAVSGAGMATEVICIVRLGRLARNRRC